ncbi:MAG: AIPR family protein [Mycobacteriales bacterium]
MVDNELVLLDQVLRQRQAERSTPLRDDDAFELFACEQVLRDRDLSVEEVALGVVGGGNDGAIDGVYVFLGGDLLSEDSDVFQEGFAVGKVAAGTRLSLWLVQAKREMSFTETALDKVANSTRRLLSLAESDADLVELYSPAVVARTGLFRAVLQILATRHLQVEVHFSYVSRGRTDQINAKVEIKATDLERQLSAVVTGATAHVEFLGAAELWRRVNTVPSYTTELVYQENATSGNSHVALVKLRDYLKFITDDEGNLRRHIFELNVRDYQGDVEVNKEIKESLEDPEAPEFWWLNNGVTIVCSKTSIISKTYVLDDVQIVNGLQTSYTLHRVLGNFADDHPALDRSVLVRILATSDDPAIRDRVIRATNRQTSVPAASLRATDGIQRNIESFFLAHGWFYDRRKNFYRNNGKSPERIVGIPLLAQAVMAMGLSRPDDSRARPSSLLKRDDDYKEIFSHSVPLPVYLWLAKSQKKIDAFLLSEEADVTTQERTNLRFHLAMIAAAKLLGQPVRSPGQLKTIAADDRGIESVDLTECLREGRESFELFAASTGDAADKIAKGSEFVGFLLKRALPPSVGAP